MWGFGRPATEVVMDLLERQYKALLQGRLSDLDGMAERIETAMNGLHQRGGPPGEVAQIQKLAARNARLLKSALAGVAQARGQLTAKRDTALTTYDASGRTHGYTPATARTLSRR